MTAALECSYFSGLPLSQVKKALRTTEEEIATNQMQKIASS
jgi:hypothetical protein